MHFTVTTGAGFWAPRGHLHRARIPTPGAEARVTSREGDGSSLKLCSLHPATSSQLPSSIFGQEKDSLFRNCFGILSFWFWKTSVLPSVKTITGTVLCVTGCSRRSGSSGGGEGQWQGLEGRATLGTILLLVLGKHTLLQALLAQACTLWISSGTGSAEKTWNSIPREEKKWDQKTSGGNYAGCAQPAAALNPRAASTSRVPTLGPAGPRLPRARPRPPSKPALTSGLPGAPSAQEEET